jgi:hypothetical protein
MRKAKESIGKAKESKGKTQESIRKAKGIHWKN